ncbi:glycine--tRNA ligase [Patescibacteria group bacterium]
MKNDNPNNLMEKITSLAKRRGFLFQSSEIYGGINACYDYGPLGVELKNNVKKAWWDYMVRDRSDIEGIDASILMHPKVWEASGHLKHFTDPLVDCKKCKKRFKEEDILESAEKKVVSAKGGSAYGGKGALKCPECGGELTEARNFNLMFKTHMGPVESKGNEIYLRPETAQGIYVNFKNVLDSTGQKVPFGIAQIGKAFRNEITPGNLTFRLREFEQMEMQYFVNPKKATKYFDYWLKERKNWYLEYGLTRGKIKVQEHQEGELAHYAKKAVDIQYEFPFGFKELEGIHNRTDYDLIEHEEASGKDLNYIDQVTNEKFIPWIVETSGGIDRAALAFLIDAYTEVKGGRSEKGQTAHETEVVLKLDKRLAPIKVAVLPLSRKEELTKEAIKIFDLIKKDFKTKYDETGSIGKRYRRQDEIGTPYCVTIDFETLKDKAVTVRDRDTMEQERVKVKELKDYLGGKLNS